MTAKRNFWSVGGNLGCLCIVLALLVSAGPVEAKGTFTLLPVDTQPTAINDSGTVVGGDSSGLGFLRTPDGTITKFNAAPDIDSTKPQSINSGGAITGSYVDRGGLSHGFVRNAHGAITTFDAPGAGQQNNQGTLPISINAHHVVVGLYVDQSGDYHSFVRAADGTITSLDLPGALQTVVSGINDNGDIVGTVYDSRAHGFVRSADGTITTFDAPGADIVFGTQATAINNKGVIAGYCPFEAEVWHGFVRQPDGTFATIDAGAGPELYATAINTQGTVAGRDVDEKGRFQGFVRYLNGKLKTIRGPHSRGGTYVSGMNDHGIVIGDLPGGLKSNGSHGFIWTP